MQRRLCSAILVLEAIVLGLSTLVLVNVTEMSKSVGLSVGLGLCLVALLTSGLLRFRWAYAIGWLVQIAAIAMAVETLTLGFLGLVFMILWITAVRLGARVDRDKAGWAA